MSARGRSGRAVRPRARVLAGVGLVAAVAVVSGCATGPITAGRLQASIAPTFANLWILHEADVGHPHPTVAALQSTATCQKGSPLQPQHGSGNDWVCHVTWLVAGPQTPVTASYSVNVQTNGCYTADGDGPSAVNGATTLIDAQGRTRVNPLRSFNGCFDTT